MRTGGSRPVRGQIHPPGQIRVPTTTRTDSDSWPDFCPDDDSGFVIGIGYWITDTEPALLYSLHRQIVKANCKVMPAAQIIFTIFTSKNTRIY